MKSAFVVLFIIVSMTVAAQPSLWVRYQWRWQMTGSLRTDVELEERRILDNGYFDAGRYSRLLPRVTVTRKVGTHWTAGLSYGHFLVGEPTERRTFAPQQVRECRPHGELTWQRGERTTWTQRMRYDHRIMMDPSHLSPANAFHRWRYLAEVRIPLNDTQKRFHYALQLGNELMLQSDRWGRGYALEQNRVLSGVSLAWDRWAMLSITWMRILYWQQLPADVIRITFLHTITNKNQKH